jgi:Cu-Zn family superoxide dismutase
MPRMRTALLILAGLVLGGTGAAFAAVGHGHRGVAVHVRSDVVGGHGKRSQRAIATLRDAAGKVVGHVWLSQRRRGGDVELLARVRGLAPGFHGLHIHSTGRCDAPGFMTAGGHLNPTGASHPAHAGDLPSLLVNADGTGVLAAATDRFSIANLRDADGSAVIVHSGPDDFANIPARYGTPDQETLNTGDSGTRVACGVVRRPAGARSSDQSGVVASQAAERGIRLASLGHAAALRQRAPAAPLCAIHQQRARPSQTSTTSSTAAG